MLKVEGYALNDEAKVLEFIRKVQANAKPDKEILSRSVLIKDDGEIVGMVSYESHGDLGVIRYFLYDTRAAGTDLAVGMFFELYKRARESGIKKLIAQIPSPEVAILFEMLGFSKVTGDISVYSSITRPGIEIMAITLDGLKYE